MLDEAQLSVGGNTDTEVTMLLPPPPRLLPVRMCELSLLRVALKREFTAEDLFAPPASGFSHYRIPQERKPMPIAKSKAATRQLVTPPVYAALP